MSNIISRPRGAEVLALVSQSSSMWPPTFEGEASAGLALCLGHGTFFLHGCSRPGPGCDSGGMVGCQGEGEYSVYWGTSGGGLLKHTAWLTVTVHLEVKSQERRGLFRPDRDWSCSTELVSEPLEAPSQR